MKEFRDAIFAILTTGIGHWAETVVRESPLDNVSEDDYPHICVDVGKDEITMQVAGMPGATQSRIGHCSIYCAVKSKLSEDGGYDESFTTAQALLYSVLAYLSSKETEISAKGFANLRVLSLDEYLSKVGTVDCVVAKCELKSEYQWAYGTVMIDAPVVQNQ